MTAHPALHDVPRWRRSSRSVGMNNCVEAARLDPARLAVRDSKDTARPPLRFSAPAWASFVTSLKEAGSPERTG
ncbi:DUF397 domain-containing protein [Streptomyces lavendofoliae]|uniref:DUF397 domain-containing protein n=1 Tax=Streptomyces lavendofoliae TaxID=67314 RepID=UPI003D8AFAAD